MYVVEIVRPLDLVILILSSFGGGAIIVVALSSWLGSLWASRILQNERGLIETQLVAFRHDLGLVRATYENHLNRVLDYYDTFWRHYRLCQQAASADAIRSPNGRVSFTKESFLNQLDEFLSEWAEQEGRIRLILPSRVLEQHEHAIKAFNAFKRAIDKFDNSPEGRKRKKEAFENVHSVKERMEKELRDFLKTEKLIE